MEFVLRTKTSHTAEMKVKRVTCCQQPLELAIAEREIVYWQLDSLRWFSQRRSQTPHFFGGGEGAQLDVIRTRQRLLYNALTPSLIILCLLVRKLSCWQTNEQTDAAENIQRSKTVWFPCYHGPYLSALAMGSSHNRALYKCPMTLLLL